MNAQEVFEVQLDALIEAIIIKTSGITDGYRPTWESFNERADEMQALLDDEVKEVKELYNDILSDRLYDMK